MPSNPRPRNNHSSGRISDIISPIYRRLHYSLDHHSLSQEYPPFSGIHPRGTGYNAKTLRAVYLAQTFFFEEIVYLVKDDPAFIHRVLDMQGQFVARLLARILPRVDFDGAIFSEPIAGNSGPLISPTMYQSFALSSYEPILAVLRRHGVKNIIARTYANARILLPSFLKWGFNCLWACETGNASGAGATMDYLAIRREYGRDLRLIAGIDTDVLRGDEEDIRREVKEKVPPLLASGGYMPLADGRVRVEIPYENYAYYRELLAEVIAEQGDTN